MNIVNKEQLDDLLQRAVIKRKFVKELRFKPDLPQDVDYELVAIADRSGNAGIVIVDVGEIYIAAYTIMRRLTDNKTGRSKPITCDFCYTWQAGANAAMITFERPTDKHRLAFLCCADLKCSLHVRNRTPESLLSRANLHEDIDETQRVARLASKLKKLMTRLEQPHLQS